MTMANNRRAATAIGMVVALLLGPVPPMLKASHAAGAEESVCPPPGAEPTDVFADDDDHIHESAINCAAQYDLVGGFDGGAYGPDASITRAQMASVLVRLLDLAGVDLPAASNAPDVFDDDDGSIHESNINVLAALGVARGVGPATFAPNRSLSRAQLTSFVVQALENILERRLDRSTDAFDDDEGSVHEGAINALAAAGVVHGVAARRFAPDDHVTRGQTAAFVIGSAAVLHDHGRWPPTHGASVVLDHRTVTAGSAATGAVLGGEMTGAHVSGCGLQRHALHDHDSARGGLQFEATVPAVQPAGDCVLTFVVSFRQAPNHAVEETITVAAPVTAPADGDSGDSGDSDSDSGGSGGDTAPSATIAPTLASCRRTGQRSTADGDFELVVFQFDQDVTGAAPNPDRFHLYRRETTNFNAAGAVASGNVVRAEFPVGVVNHATLCTVDRGAVTGVSGLVNPIGDAGVDPTTHQALATVPPDLEAVGNLRTDVVGRIYADFTFDEDVHNQPAAGRFKLISTDGSTFRGQALSTPTEAPGQAPFTPPGNVISVQFAAMQVQLPLSQVARGVVEEDTVCDARPLCNALQVADMRLAGITNAPDLVSARITGGGATFTFDEPVAPLGQPDDGFDASRFGIYDGSGAWNTGSYARLSETDPRVVDVGFQSTGAAPSGRGDGAASGQVPRGFQEADGVGAFVFDDAVAKSNSELVVPNGDDEVPLQPLEPYETPGRTWGPELVAAATFTDASGDTVVRYTFDGTAPTVSWDALRCEDFALYDLAGTEFVPLARDGKPCRMGPADSTAAIREVAGDSLSADVYGFPEGSVDAAVRAAVHDSLIGGGSNPNGTRMRFPEGAEPLSRG